MWDAVRGTVSPGIGIRGADVDWLRSYVNPAQEPHKHVDGGEALKSDMSTTPTRPKGADPRPVGCSRAVGWGGECMVTDGLGGPASKRCNGPGDAAGSRDDPRLVRGVHLPHPPLPHFFASKLIRHGIDVKRVQKLMRHASATTTLNAYAGLWSNDDELARGALTEL